MGPAPMIRMVEMSVLLGIKSHGLGIGHKKRARGRASLHPKRQVTLARGWSLDQIPQPRKGLKGPINRHLDGLYLWSWWGSLAALPSRSCAAQPSLFELRRGKQRRLEARPGFEP